MPERSQPAHDVLLARLSKLLAGHIGLHFPQERYSDLLRGMKAAARELGHASIEACIHWLLASRLSRREVEILASHLTVGETYFFRETRSFEILEERILFDLIRARGDAERRLRIWSAGCCTGEEPYSIAMLLERLIPDIEEWNITILATDINPQFLRKAAEGVYGEWSFRGTPAWLRERYFRRKSDKWFEIVPRLRKRVTFSHLNLADDAYPSLSNNTNAMDVIFCRNVLMYFTPAQAKKVADNLHRSLVDGGWLIVSPTETSNSLFSRFAAVGFPGAVLYRKAAGAEPRVIATAHPAPALFPFPEPLHLEPSVQEAASPMAPEEAPPEPVRPAAAPGDAPSVEARACANQGKLAEAVIWCEKAIAADKLNPACHYLLAAIQQELGQHDGAVQSLSRALYLDADFVLAHFALGNLRLARGQRREAERHFDTALSLLRAHPRDEVLPESDGLTAGRLGEIIASVRSSLPRAPKERLA
jgi:chemotaxis protein methyltransferase CheR